MWLETGEFIRLLLMHILPEGYHRIRHYGLLAGATRKAAIASIRDLLGQRPAELKARETAEPATLTLRQPCHCCDGRLRIVVTFRRGQAPLSRAPPREQVA